MGTGSGNHEQAGDVPGRAGSCTARSQICMILLWLPVIDIQQIKAFQMM